MTNIPINWVKNKQGQRVYAKAHLKSVIDSEGNTLEDILGQIEGLQTSIELDTVTVSSTFPKNSRITIDGITYRATEDVSELPFTPVMEDGKIVYEEINGARAYVFLNNTLNTGWVKVSDNSLDFAIQSAISDAAKLGSGYAICTTGGGTAAKVVSIDNFILRKNGVISILFTNGFTTTNSTLNINGTGAKAIKIFGKNIEPGRVRKNTVISMQYDGVAYNVISIQSQVGPSSGNYVDLGLPSGILWADRNVGAESPEDDGLYFSWGNIEGHTGTDEYDFGSSNDGPYASTSGAALTGNISVGNTYDAARHNIGEPWRMPTSANFTELVNNCTSEWISQNGVDGMRFTSRINGNSIFMPASGFRNGTSLNYRGSLGYYWSSSLNSSTDSYCLGFTSGGVAPASINPRFDGFSVRAVQ